MKKILLGTVILFTFLQVLSQKDANLIPKIGDKAPSFKAVTTNGKITFPDDFGRSWKILFSHPQDYTPVCSSELLELAYLQDKFNELGIRIAVISTDPVDSHKKWKSELEKIKYKGRDEISIDFPIIDDEELKISRSYGMIHPKSNSTKTVRGIFIIDPDNEIQSISFYPMTIGRNIDEIIRTVEALQIVAANNVLTPANWNNGDDYLAPYPPSADYDEEKLKKEGYYSLSWFMLFKKP